MADEQQELRRSLARLEARFEKVAGEVAFLKTVVVTFLVIGGLLFALSVSSSVFVFAPHLLFPAFVVVLFILFLLFKGKPEP